MKKTSISVSGNVTMSWTAEQQRLVEAIHQALKASGVTIPKCGNMGEKEFYAFQKCLFQELRDYQCSGGDVGCLWSILQNAKTPQEGLNMIRELIGQEEWNRLVSGCS